MISSMTAFARGELQGEWGSIAWEIRSLNHRFLEIGLRLPELFNALEPKLRETLKTRLQRGKVDIALRYVGATGSSQQLSVNKELAAQLMHARAEIAALSLQAPPVDPTDILRWPGVLQSKEVDTAELQQAVLNLFNQTLDDFIAMRQREGQALKAILIARLEAMKLELKKVALVLPQISAALREKTITRLNEAKINFEQGRLEQELIFYAQKMDVTEEIDRLHTHIAEAHTILSQGNSVGRRLDFLMQELNREANTLGAKSAAVATSQTSMELKILIEQMREQVQNIE